MIKYYNKNTLKMSRELVRYKDQELDSVINDLIARFLIFLPEKEKKSPRIFQALLEAHWFYADFLAKNNCADEKINEDTKYSILPQKKEKEFFRLMFEKTPFLVKQLPRFSELYNDFKNYQTKIPRFGAIILNETMTKVLLVVSWNGSFYDFPKGKVDEDENDVDCAAREVYEEIGFDISSLISEEDYIVKWNNSLYLNTEPSIIDSKFEKYVKLYIVSGVKETEEFEIRTRKEIKRIEWVRIDFLRKNLIEEKFNIKYSNVRPFIFLLAKYIAYKQGKITSDELHNINEGNTSDEESKFELAGKIPYYKKAKNLHFVELDFDNAYKYYNKAIECFDNSINALELLISLALNYRGGIEEAFKLLKNFQCLFYNINDYQKHLDKLTIIQSSKDEDENSTNVVIEAVDREFNVEYPMIKEMAFRECTECSYVIRQINQIFIKKGVGEESQFISNSTLKSEISKNKGHEKHILKSYHCYRMLDFYSESLAKNYFLKRKEHNEHIYLLKADDIEIDSIKGNIFLIKEFERKIETSKIKKEKKLEGIIKRKAKMEKKEEKKEQIEEKEEKIGLKEEDIQEIDAIVKMRMDMFRERMKKRLCEVLG